MNTPKPRNNNNNNLIFIYAIHPPKKKYPEDAYVDNNYKLYFKMVYYLTSYRKFKWNEIIDFLLKTVLQLRFSLINIIL